MRPLSFKLVITFLILALVPASAVLAAPGLNISVRANIQTIDHRPSSDAVLREFALPAYGSALVVAGIAGEVVLEVKVDEVGEVQDLKIVGSPGKEFAEASVAAVKKWKFAPARVGKEAIPTVVLCTIKFNVEQE